MLTETELAALGAAGRHDEVAAILARRTNRQETNDVTIISRKTHQPRTVELTGRDSIDQADLYLDGKLVLPALTRAERDDLFQQLAHLDAAATHPYDVQELRGLDLPHAMALVHHAGVANLALYHDGELVADWPVDPRLTTAQVRERAEELAAEVSRRVRDGEL